MKRRLLFGSAALMLLSVSCEPLSEDSTNCDSTAECMFGDVCILPERACVPEQLNTVVGSFSCNLAGSGQQIQGLGATDVIATLQDDRWPLTSLASCVVNGEGTAVVASVWLFESDTASTYFVMTLPIENVASGNRTDLDAYGGFLMQDPEKSVIGGVDNVSVWTSPTQPGERLEGYVRGSLFPMQ